MISSLLCAASLLAWPEPTAEMKPWVYNWWMGSAVDKAGIEFQCKELKDKGFGGFHVIPIYGAKGYENKYRSLLSPEWIDAWNMAARTARANSLEVDLTMGAGWCFGGPWITEEDAASSKMKVKRAGLGGAGYMLDPFSPKAMSNHVARFEAAFGENGTAERPRAFYHDSYEYFNALPKTPGDIDEMQVATFTVWSDWCRKRGYLTRNEAHGAPANWLDLYQVADIPETEMFGKKDRDILISKFASSAAYARGTKLVSAESCTWIDEHFCERPAEIKELIDMLFLSGVNHVFYHGMCYSPVDVVWPGWCFYASLEMNPRNPIWREMASLNAYITRCQSLFQTWTSDNDIALIYDMTAFRKKGFNPGLSVHGSDWFYGQAIGKVARKLYDRGYTFDYVSPAMLKRGLPEGKYRDVMDPEKVTEPVNARPMPFNKESGIMATRWKKDARTMYFAVNVSNGPILISADGEFSVMDPMSGAIYKSSWITLQPKHSAFIVDARNIKTKRVSDVQNFQRLVASGWKVRPLVGGPAMPEEKALEKPQYWNTWDEAFSGTMEYSATFDKPAMAADAKLLEFDLGQVQVIARMRINGIDAGVVFMPPYRFVVPAEILKEKGNLLEIEVTSLGSNRLRWNDVTGVNWKYFHDINMVNMNYLPMDASKRSVIPCGLSGDIKWRSAK